MTPCCLIDNCAKTSLSFHHPWALDHVEAAVVSATLMADHNK